MEIAQLLFNGLAVGSIIALGAVGLTLTYGILRLSNFAHGDFLTWGAYLSWFANTKFAWFASIPILGSLLMNPGGSGLKLWLAIALGILGTVGLMVLSEKILWQRMREQKADTTTLTIISIGLALFLRSLILFIWGSSNQNYDLPVVPALPLWGLKVEVNRLVVILMAIAAMVALHFLLQKTKIGKSMRAVADNLDLARVSGIDVETVVLWTWVITAVLTALAGGMYGLMTTVRPNMGWFLILPMFASAILGGIGNPYGAITGAFVIGIAQELSVLFLSPDYKMGVALLMMVVLLLVRPQGLFSD